MKSKIMKYSRICGVLGMALAGILFFAPEESSATIKCDLKQENMCRLESQWIRSPEQNKMPSPKKNDGYEYFAHRRGNCGPEALEGDDMGCMHGRQHRGRGMHGMHGMHGRHHQTESDATALCPQERNTVPAPPSFLEMKNPLANRSESVEQGRLLFHQNVEPSCVMCHGSLGDGNGQMGMGLTPPPRNFTCTETMQDIPDGQLFWIIKNGSEGTGMPAFGHLEDESVWQLILYIRHLAEK